MWKKTAEALRLFTLIIMSLCVIFFPSVTAESVRSSADRCLNLLLPAIFPMMVLSNQLAGNFAPKNGRIVNIASRFFGISAELLPQFIIGCLCGYPLPASISAEKYRKREISKEQAEFICAVSNGASPAFLITFIGTGIYGSIAAGIALYFSQITASVICAHVFRCPSGIKCTPTTPNHPLSESIKSSVKNFAYLSGFAMFFSLVADLFTHTAIHAGTPHNAARIIACVFDATGIMDAFTSLFAPIREIVLCIICATGGISVFFQIRSVFYGCDISMRLFLKCRIITGSVMAVTFLIFMKILAFLSLQ